MPDINITEPGVNKILTKLKPHKTPGPDDISPFKLKEMADRSLLYSPASTESHLNVRKFLMTGRK